MDTNEQIMLTTVDNPYDPFTQFDDWYHYDIEKGYRTCEYLTRIMSSSPALSERDQLMEYNRAIDEIIQYNLLGIYKKVESAK